MLFDSVILFMGIHPRIVHFFPVPKRICMRPKRSTLSLNTPSGRRLAYALTLDVYFRLRDELRGQLHVWLVLSHE